MVRNLKSWFAAEPKNSWFFLANRDIISGRVKLESRKEKERKQRRRWRRKNVQWSAEETKCLVAIWASPEFQEKLETSTRKSKLYNELLEEMAKAGFTRTPDQIINKLKKLKKKTPFLVMMIYEDCFGFQCKSPLVIFKLTYSSGCCVYFRLCDAE